MNRKQFCFGLILSLASGAQADFVPIALQAESYNMDVVVEKGAPPALIPATTASMDAGVSNADYGWYEKGYNTDSPDSGLPGAGTTFTSESAADHSFKMAPSYAAANAVLIDPANTNATLTVTSPAAYSGLSFLLSSGNGSDTIACKVYFADGTTSTGTVTSGDWFNGENPAYTANGRLNVGSRGFDNVDNGNPRLYAADLAISSASAVTKIELTLESGAGHAGIFAVSGLTGGAYQPIDVTGFTQDMIVEKGAAHPGRIEGATTGTLDDGYANTGATWYEQGYNTQAPATGLPAAGTTVTGLAATDHAFLMPASYTENNAAILDTANMATLTLTTPASYSALSFLASSGGGEVAIDYTVNYANGQTQTGTLRVPDWYNTTQPVAINANGRINVDSAGFESVDTGNPKLFAVDLQLTTTTSAVKSIDLLVVEGTGHACIMAVSGAGGAVKPIIDGQPTGTNAFTGTSVTLTASVSGTAPLAFQWQKVDGSNYTALAEGAKFAGVASASLTVKDGAIGDTGDFAVIVSNVAGSVTSAVARVSFLAGDADITAPGDPTVMADGTAPDAEGVEHAIDNLTDKYLNFGTDGDQNAPFVGPVGLVVTPSAAAGKVVTGLRIYTANDSEARDPADFKLEGSNDGGTTYTFIASGALKLPAARNAAGLEIDPLALNNQEVHFANNKVYSMYRVTFANVKDNAGANSVQFAELELLPGVPTVAAPTLTVTRGADGTAIIQSTGSGTLQSTTALNGAATVWQDEGAIAPSKTVSATEGTKFFRVLAQ